MTPAGEVTTGLLRWHGRPISDLLSAGLYSAHRVQDQACLPVNTSHLAYCNPDGGSVTCCKDGHRSGNRKPRNTLQHVILEQ
jgi:hypothetical protein